jgi:hypothetical protein
MLRNMKQAPPINSPPLCACKAYGTYAPYVEPVSSGRPNQSGG